MRGVIYVELLPYMGCESSAFSQETGRGERRLQSESLVLANDLECLNHDISKVLRHWVGFLASTW